MDNLVLTSVARDLERSLRDALLADLLVEAPHRWRIRFERPDGRSASLVVSLRPELPWIGRPAFRAGRARLPRDPLAAQARRALGGVALAAVRKPPGDRSVALEFVSGARLVAELSTHGGNLLLVDAAGAVLHAARAPRAGKERVTPGAAYRPAPPPPRLVDVERDGPEAVDRRLRERTEHGVAPLEALRRGVFGVGTEGARLLLAEAAAGEGSVGSLLAGRVEELRRGSLAPVILAAQDPAGDDVPGLRLLPWEPREAPSGPERAWRREDATATAGLYHDAVERATLRRRRSSALRGILARELERIDAAERRVGDDLAAFDDPERHRRHAEALLAGIGRARIRDAAAVVPDPYDPEQRDVVVPIAPELNLQQNAEALFRRHRRALRGLERARRRAEELGRRRERLVEVQLRDEREEDPERLERAMRDEGIPVGLEPRGAKARGGAAARRPRLEGVRMLTSRDGLRILVGRGGRDNHRLTFDLAGPEDFWLHAQGHAGAHVVIRNPLRAKRPPEATLREAAEAAAWWSRARGQGAVDVQWTRRKYVRHPRGAAPGRVVLKRFETVRVRPREPGGRS